MRLREEEPWLRGLAHLGDGYRHWMVLGGPAAAETEFRASLAAFRDLGDRWGTTVALTHLAGFVAAQGEPERAVALVDEALSLADELGAVENQAELLCQRAQCRLRAGDHEAAADDLTRALELGRRSGAPECTALAHLGLAELARQRGEFQRSRELCEAAVAEGPPEWFVGPGTHSEALVVLGRLGTAEGDLESARRYFTEALDAEQSDRSRPFVTLLAEAVADLALRRGDPAHAAELLGLARACQGQAPSPDARRTERTARAALGETAYRSAHDRGAARDFADVHPAIRRLLTTA
jgi:tetratricopeptide (TPR) repeat protein